MEIQFTIPGAPVGKGRPRVTRYGTFTPQKTKDYEEKVRLCWQTQSGSTFPPQTALEARIRAYFPIPASYSRRLKTALEDAFHVKKPDADNVAKAILDALNGHAFPDDSAVCLVHIQKKYTNAAPRVEVEIKEAT